jgi:uncharacterized membrane protein YsdA (DUF1294 family)
LELNLSKMDFLFDYFWILNVIGFLLNAFDKLQAKSHKQRIPETTLLTFVFFGGTVGSGLAMLLFRHKTSKTSYLLKFWLIVILQILAICFVSLDYEI